MLGPPDNMEIQKSRLEITNSGLMYGIFLRPYVGHFFCDTSEGKQLMFV